MISAKLKAYAKLKLLISQVKVA